MKTSTAEDFAALFLGIISHLSTVAALTIPTHSSIELANASSSVLPILFPSLNTTISSLTASHFDPICAPIDDDEAWYNVPAEMKWRYDPSCYEAIRLFSKEQQRHDADAFEFLAPGAQPKTRLKTMQTPRRYSFGGHWNPSCTVVVAMLNFASPGQLPEQPDGPFQPTDVASFEELLDAGGEIFTQCIRARGVGILPALHFGWVRAGRRGNIGVFFTGTKSQIDRSIPRGVHP